MEDGYIEENQETLSYFSQVPVYCLFYLNQLVCNCVANVRHCVCCVGHHCRKRKGSEPVFTFYIYVFHMVKATESEVNTGNMCQNASYGNC
jgi:hypothetical protein